jgi:cell surface protein SprA
MNNSLTTRFEIKRDRQVTLSLSNNQIQEQIGNTYSIGLGYQIDDFEFSLSSANGNRTFSSNLDLNVDVSIRKSASAYRSLQENTHQPVSGSTDISVKTSADYVLSDRVNIQLFYDRMVKKYDVATSYDSVDSQFGVKLRFTFGT